MGVGGRIKNMWYRTKKTPNRTYRFFYNVKKKCDISIKGVFYNKRIGEIKKKICDIPGGR